MNRDVGIDDIGFYGPPLTISYDAIARTRGLGERGREAAQFTRRSVVPPFEDPVILAGGCGGRAIVVIGTPPGARPAALTAALQSGFVSPVRSLAAEYGRRSIACNALLVDGNGGGAAVLESVLSLASEGASFVNGEAIDLRRV